MWIDTHKPQNTAEILGQSSAIKRVERFLHHFGKQKKCMVITGNNGIGKTLVANIVPRDLGYVVKQVDDDHDLKSLMNMTNFFGVQDNVAIVYEACYIKNIKKDIEILKTSTQPVFIVADEGELEKYKSIKRHADVVCLRLLKREDVKPLMEHIGYTGDLPECDIDLRSLLLNLEFGATTINSKDCPYKNIHKTIPVLFDYTVDMADKCELYFQDPRQVSNLVYINYPKVMIKPIRHEYDCLKKKMEKQLLQRVIEKATRDAKKTKQKKVSVKKPKITMDDMNAIYKTHMVSEAADCFTDADILTHYTHVTHDYCLEPETSWMYAAGCSRIAGNLSIDKISSYQPYVKKPSCRYVGCRNNALHGVEVGKPELCNEHKYS